MWYNSFVAKVGNSTDISEQQNCSSRTFGPWAPLGVVQVDCVAVTRYVSLAYSSSQYIGSYKLCEVRVLGTKLGRYRLLT